VNSPLLETTIDGASGVIFSVTGGADMTLHEVNEAAEIVYDAVDPEANIIFGSVIDEKLHGEIQITVIATGFELTGSHAQSPQKEAAIAGVQSPFESFMRRNTSPEPVAVGAGYVGANAPQAGVASSMPSAEYTPSRGNSMADAARRILDLPDFLRPRK
jgi:cell division protein FtsZ